MDGEQGRSLAYGKALSVACLNSLAQQAMEIEWSTSKVQDGQRRPDSGELRGGWVGRPTHGQCSLVDSSDWWARAHCKWWTEEVMVSAGGNLEDLNLNVVASTLLSRQHTQRAERSFELQWRRMKQRQTSLSSAEDRLWQA